MFNEILGGVSQVPGHSGLEYLNVGRINDVIQLRDVIIESLPITHSKSSERWKNVSYWPQTCSLASSPRRNTRYSLFCPCLAFPSLPCDHYLPVLLQNSRARTRMKACSANILISAAGRGDLNLSCDS